MLSRIDPKNDVTGRSCFVNNENDVNNLIAYIIMYLNLTNQIYPILMILKFIILFASCVINVKCHKFTYRLCQYLPN